jgi:Zn-dependent M28 family amino/carboxypeptidase
MTYFFNIKCAALFTVTSLATFSSTTIATQPSKINHAEQANYFLKQLVSPNKGIGAREAGTDNEQQAANYIEERFKQFGYRVTVQKFTFSNNSKQSHSSNIIAELGDPTKPTIILGAHYDSTAMKAGSMGAIDNGAGVAAMLAIAQALTKNGSNNYNIRFIAFGAEEIGLKGSNHYVEQLLKNNQLNNIIAMINFDTVAGGDKVYVHSAHSTPYRQCKNRTYSSETSIRDALLSASINVLGEEGKYVIHPDYAGYPEGETGSWSDHASFSCAGIPIAYVESTNFAINGRSGYDGFSQSTSTKLWSCYDENN